MQRNARSPPIATAVTHSAHRQVVLYGGVAATGEHLADAHIMDCATHSWTKLEGSIQARTPLRSPSAFLAPLAPIPHILSA